MGGSINQTASCARQAELMDTNLKRCSFSGKAAFYAGGMGA